MFAKHSDSKRYYRATTTQVTQDEILSLRRMLLARPSFPREGSWPTHSPEQAYSQLDQSSDIGKSIAIYKRIFRSRAWHLLSNGLLLAIFAIMAVVYAPDIYYMVFPVSQVPVAAQESGTVNGGKFSQGATATREDLSQEATASSPVESRYLPAKNENLPEGEWLIIPRIGVRTEYVRTQLNEDPEKALKDGVWFVPGYGEPGDLTQPTIMAAHRFGYKWWWQDDYWKYHSFYNLPETEPGDIIEIIQDQRKFTYEIYAGQENDEITDYDADLILYTCKFLNSPVRHVRYARLVK